MTAVLAGVDLTVVRGGRRILDGATVSIPPGSVTAVLGPNGSGKTTMMSMLAGFLRGEPDTLRGKSKGRTSGILNFARFCRTLHMSQNALKRNRVLRWKVGKREH